MLCQTTTALTIARGGNDICEAISNWTKNLGIRCPQRNSSLKPVKIVADPSNMRFIPPQHFTGTF